MSISSRAILLGLPLALFLQASDSTAKTYTIQTAAGSDFVGDNGPATAAVFSQTEGIAVDRAGNIYVADADDNRVRKITPDGVIHTVAGTGTAGFLGDGGPGTAARSFGTPRVGFRPLRPRNRPPCRRCPGEGTDRT